MNSKASHKIANNARINKNAPRTETKKIVLNHMCQDYIEIAEDIRHSPDGKASYALRSRTIERVFADAKEIHSMRYTYHKSLAKVTNWVSPKFVATNLKKMSIWKFKSPCALNMFKSQKTPIFRFEIWGFFDNLKSFRERRDF